MTTNLTRRHVLKLALNGGVMVAACSVAASGYFAQASSAGAPASATLLGVHAGNVPAGGPASGVPLEAATMDLASGGIQSQPVPQVLQDGVSPLLTVTDSITGCCVLSDGTLLVAITPVTASKRASDPTRLVRISGSTATGVTVTGLKQLEQLSSLTATNTGAVLALGYKKNGAPPARVVSIDPQTGAATDYAGVHLPGNVTFRTLTLCPNGTLYATAVAGTGDTSLMQLTSNQTQVLTSGGVVWNNGLASLVCAATDQLVALGAPRYKTPNALYAVDPNSGTMSRIRDFNVDKMTLAHM
jgi:hypothetical protein